MSAAESDRMNKPLTRNIRAGQAPRDLKAYEAVGGYVSVRKAIKELTPQASQAVAANTADTLAKQTDRAVALHANGTEVGDADCSPGPAASPGAADPQRHRLG